MWIAQYTVEPTSTAYHSPPSKYHQENRASFPSVSNNRYKNIPFGHDLPLGDETTLENGPAATALE